MENRRRTALDEAEAIVERLQARYSSSLELERAIFDELCAQLTFNEMLEKEPGEDAPGVSAAFALTHGWANCQGYSDAFYLLAGMAGFEVGFQNGYNAGVLHAWNTVELGGQWYVVDVSTADIAGDLVAPETGVYTLFNAGRDRCAGALSWDPVWETADIADGSGGSYFFHAGIPGFGATFDDLDLMAQYCYNKRAYDGDKGLNTGGMGTFTPCPFYDKETADEVMQKIMLPTVAAMNAEGRPFKGVLYFGLMRTKEGMKVVEYNSRFGDPETQVVLPMLKTDLMEIFEAVTDERLADVDIEWESGACVCVVLASGGYPLAYRKGEEIKIGDVGDCTVIHAGTAIKDGRLVTNGGRVLNVVARGIDVEEARKKAYAAVKNIGWKGMQYRTDIGVKYREG